MARTPVPDGEATLTPVNSVELGQDTSIDLSVWDNQALLITEID